MKNHKRQAASRSRKVEIFSLALAIVIAVSTGLTTAFLSTKTPVTMNTFYSAENPCGDIQLTKTVEHPYGDAYTVPENVRFNFEVDLGKDLAGKKFGKYTADENGIIRVEMKAGDVKTIEKIPDGTKAVIKEVNIPNGFTVKGESAKEVTVTRSETVDINFVNVYRPEPASTENVAVEGAKNLEGREWEDGDKFVLNLEEYVDDEWKKIDSAEVSKEHRGFDFSDALKKVSLNERRAYSFRISEDENSLKNVIYDSTINYFDVVIDDADMDGTLEISDIISHTKSTEITKDESNGKRKVNVTFTNVYKPELEDIVSITVHKKMKDNSGQEKDASGYRFGLYDESGEELLDECEANSSGNVMLKMLIRKEDLGKRKLTVREIEDAEKGVSYDSKVYKLNCDVVEDSNGDIKSKTYEGDANVVPHDAGNTYDVYFENSYDPDDATIKITGDKNLSGREIVEGEFQFELYETDESYDIKGKKPVDTVSNSNSAGSFSFDIVYSKVGTHCYVICEKKNGISGISYDDTKYMVKTKVVDEGGKLKAQYEVINGVGDDKKIVFNNKYIPNDGTIKLTGTKKLVGKTLQKGDYSFLLYESDSSFENEKKICTAANDAQGHFEFNTLQYDKEGKYYYIVREDDSDPAEGVKYDKNEYHVTVTVTDDKNGHLRAEKNVEAVNGSGNSSAGIVFTNTYSSDHASLDILAQKRLTGKKLEDNMFEFCLYATKADFNCKGLKAKIVRNNAEGDIRFKDISFYKEGEYYFVVKEKQPKVKRGISYDNSEYRIHVSVSANDDGQLVAAIKSIKIDGKTAVNKIEFHNRYVNGSIGPKTGDYTSIGFWISLLITSLVGMVVIILNELRGTGRKRVN